MGCPSLRAHELFIITAAAGWFKSVVTLATTALALYRQANKEKKKNKTKPFACNFVLEASAGQFITPK
jgi:hypothetical protein